MSLARTTEEQVFFCRKSRILTLNSTKQNNKSILQVVPETHRFSTRSIWLTTPTIYPFWWEKDGHQCRKPRNYQTWMSVSMTPSSFQAVWRPWSICLNTRFLKRLSERLTNETPSLEQFVMVRCRC